MCNSKKSIIVWLLSGCVLIFLMVIIGGITRLTHSGLSIVTWDLFGSLPPLNYQEWEEIFNLYKEYPEYKLLHYNFTLEQFKDIFFWEYLHRFTGRILGLVFLIPYIYFLAKRSLNRKLIIQTSILLIMGALQAGIGWWMVKSGLINNPKVSHYRLAIHLIIAFLTFGYTLWIMLSLIYTEKTSENKPLLKLSKILFVLIVIQIIYGAFVAGLDAGQIYNTWPKMNNQWVADSVYTISPIWKNFTQGLAGIQFVHRTLAVLILLMAIYMLSRWKKMKRYQFGDRALSILLITIVFQMIIGVLTLVLHVPMWLAIIHQIGALLLIGATIFTIFAFKKIQT